MNQPTDETIKKMMKFFEQTSLPRIEKQILSELEEKENERRDQLPNHVNEKSA